MRCHSERWTCPRRGHPEAAKASLRRRQTEENGEGFWDAKELDGGSVSSRSTSIACQSFFPREAIMGALRTGKNDFQALWLGRQSLGKCYLNPLGARAPHMQARRCCLRLQSAPRAGEQPQPGADATAG